MTDLESKNDRDADLVGYASVARFIAGDPDHSTSIYHRYKQLAARNILYLQSELKVLELRQNELDREDACDSGNLDSLNMAMDFEVLADRAKDPNDQRACERVELAREINQKLKEYEKTVLRNLKMLRLQQPTRQVHGAFHAEFNNHSNTPRFRFPRLSGVNSDMYDEADDLVTLCPPSPEEDRLTIWLRHHFPTLFMRRTRHISRHKGISFAASLSEKRLGIFVALVNVVLAAGMLFGAIYNLYYVKSEEKRLGLISGYTIAFALCVGMLTNARRSEIFGACAAYAAVLVVFVSGDLGGNSGPNG